MFTVDNLVGDTTVCNICIIILLFTIWLNRKHLLSNNGGNTGTGYKVLWCVFAIYATFYCPPLGDNWSSGQNFYYPYINGAPEENLHFEPIYFRIMDIVPYGYLLWRFVVWGILGGTSYIILSKLLKLDKHLSTIGCLTFALPNLFYYQRAVTGYCLLYIALHYFLACREKGALVKSIVIPIALCCLALLFHNAMPFYLTILIIAILFPLNKISIIILALFCIVAKNSVVDYATVFLNSTNDATTEVGMKYLELENLSNRNFFGTIFVILQKVPIFLMVFYSVWQSVTHRVNFSNIEKILLTNTLLLLIISLLFIQNPVIEGKFYVAAILPFTLFIIMFYQQHRAEKFCKYYAYTYLAIILVTNAYRIMRGDFYFSV